MGGRGRGGRFVLDAFLNGELVIQVEIRGRLRERQGLVGVRGGKVLCKESYARTDGEGQRLGWRGKGDGWSGFKKVRGVPSRRMSGMPNVMGGTTSRRADSSYATIQLALGKP